MMYEIIVSSVGARDLEKQVNQKIQDGWEPIGGVCSTDHMGFQAMIKK